MLALVCSYCGSDWFANAGRLAHTTTHAGHSQESSPKNAKVEYILGCTVGKQNLGAELLPGSKRGKEERETKTLLLLSASSQ